MGSNVAGWVGFNPNELSKNYDLCARKIRQFLEEYNNQFGVILKDIAEHWASPEAVTYCDNLVNRFNIEWTRTRNDLLNTLNTIRLAGINWANTTGYKLDLPIKDSYIKDGYYVVESSAVESINGIVGADVDFFRIVRFEGENHVYSENIVESLDEFLRAAEGLAFIGKNQMQTLNDSLTNLSISYKQMISELIKEIQEETKKAAEKYADTAGEIGKQFENLDS